MMAFYENDPMLSGDEGTLSCGEEGGRISGRKSLMSDGVVDID